MAEMTEKDKLILEVVEYLQGTCKSLHEVLEEFDAQHLEGDDDFHTELDNTLFLCAECGWWCEVGDYNMEACEEAGEDVCSNCGD